MNIKIKLPEGYLEEEIRDGYTISAKMKKVWAVELDLLIEFDRVCRKYGIKYFASGGTLLGAVRHKGFIPWDDDIDLMMMRDQYEKLCAIASTEFKHPYFFQTEYTDRGSLRGHAQLRNSETTGIIKTELETCRFNQGIFIDIFPLDAVHDDITIYDKQCKEALKIRKRMHRLARLTDRYKEKKEDFFIKRLLKKIVHYFLTTIFKNPCVYDKLYNKFEECCQRYNYLDTKMVSTLGFQFQNKQHFKYRHDFDELMECDFEFIKIPICTKYDHALKQRYGDYETILKGKSVHGSVIFDTDYPYTDYLTGKITESKSKKVLLAGLMKDTNLGDDVYPTCLEKLFSDISNEKIDFEYLDLFGRNIRCEDNTTIKKTNHLENSVDCNSALKFLIRCINFIARRINKKEYARHIIWYINPNNKKRLEKIYNNKSSDVDLIVFAGGGIIECSLNHDYYHHIDLMTKIAEKNNIPVCFNAVGRVIDEKHQFGWKIMKRALNRQCVKSITCRDGVDWINDKIYNGRNFAKSVPCFAVCVDESFDYKKVNDSQSIGIGVIRSNIFKSYGVDYEENQFLNLYIEIIQKLIYKGYDCYIFTNGYSLDYQFALKIKESFKNSNKIKVLERANDAEQLVQQIAQFKGIITARLHSCIIAYSLKIPTVAIVWGKKVKDFMALVGNKDCGIDFENLNSQFIVDKLEEEMLRGYNRVIYNDLKVQAYEAAKEIMTFLNK